jgi:glutamine amidotransferase
VITLIDYGAGNVLSVAKALETVGARVRVTQEAGAVREGSSIVLPGVGAFGDCMARLARMGLVEPILQAIGDGRTFLGICVGMQVLFEQGLEMGRHTGLGVLPGQVVRFPDWLAAKGLKVPHTGWNQIEMVKPSRLLDGLTKPTWAYFNHAYYCDAADADTAATAEHGVSFPCVVQRGNVLGMQFHPEKSQDVGLHILHNLVKGL